MFELAFLISIVTGLTEVVKRLEWVKKKYLPAVSLIFGMIASFTYVNVETIQEKVMFGLIIGLSASGLFDQTKMIVKKDDMPTNGK
ncbi:holin [Fervidibacillus halotolerans]|uniref:Holin n=1 Tax=Fervidibacillus halotolerans TaxID=2980027 RepID=A0A9E8RWJ0_9BACI|nr:holin [Fervidibacillus halotolerans]WAA11805.1 holin [Fervidibacillus halotolerans]